MTALALALSALAITQGGVAPAPGPPLPTGEIVEQVRCALDPSQTYALYLPSAYRPDRRWPVIVLMDPRGRALVPLKLFQPAAERRGYILMSSYDTASDTGSEPNVKALRAMLPETESRHSVDDRRLYLAGFSGTARIGWEFALKLKGHVAGLIGFGGGLPFESEKLTQAPFAFFGGAGRHDFNYEEMRALDAKLQSLGAPHRFEPYDGPHSWAPEPVCSLAVDWMELRAMQAGLRPRDETLVTELYERGRADAQRAGTSGGLLAASIAWSTLRDDFSGLRDVSEPAARAAELARQKPVRRALRQQDSLASRQKAYEMRLIAFLRGFHTSASPPSLERALFDLQVASLKGRMERPSDRMDADAAARLLELAFVHTSFYEPRDFLERGDPRRALALLEVAAAIRPGSPGVLYGRARALAKLGDTAAALEALRRAVEAGVSDAAMIEADEALKALRGEPAYQAILDGLRQRTP